MERVARTTAASGTLGDFACRVADDDRYSCLDIGSPSTLGGLVDPEAFNALATNQSANLALGDAISIGTGTPTLFGQTQTCGDGKRVGDGLINVFDIATALDWIFRASDSELYRGLPDVPGLVETIAGRTALGEACGASHSKRDYLVAYAQDVRFHDTPPVGTRRLSGGRRVLFADAPYENTTEAWAAQRAIGDWPPAPPREFTLPPGAWLFGTTSTVNQSLATRAVVGVGLQPLEVDVGLVRLQRRHLRQRRPCHPLRRRRARTRSTARARAPGRANAARSLAFAVTRIGLIPRGRLRAIPGVVDRLGFRGHNERCRALRAFGARHGDLRGILFM